MKTEKNILIAFLLNLFFSVFEFFGGVFTGSIAIISDAIHDIGDAISIGISYLLEKKSKHQPDDTYTYGYGRYSVIGGAITTLVLLFGSTLVVYNAILRIISPSQINYNGMIVFAIVGFFVNLAAAYFTLDGESLNQKAVNLHMLEDVFGWLIVLIGAVVMRLTGLTLIDPIMSIGVAVFIFINALKNLKEILDLFLEKTPNGIDINEIKKHIMHIDGIMDVHHIHIWSIDGKTNCATMHVVANADHPLVKKAIREELKAHGVDHITLEIESENEHCEEKQCKTMVFEHSGHKHHHHHH